MKTNSSSEELYSKYFSLTNRIVEITLKDKTILKGEFVGFFKSDLDSEESRIIKWQFVNEGESNYFGMDALGFLVGIIINQKDILEIRFLEDDLLSLKNE